jgi:predicted nucleic acid-binding protein
MLIVPDVSGIIQVLFHAGKYETFDGLLQDADLVVAPDIYVPELTNTLWKYYSAKKLTKEVCEQHIRNGIGYIDVFVDCGDLWQESFVEGIRNKHSVYDMFYMVAARRNNGILITNDSALAAICKNNQIETAY